MVIFSTKSFGWEVEFTKGVEEDEVRVLKKGSGLENEFKIAQKVGFHPNLVRIEKLYVKSYPGSNDYKHKLLMEKVEGYQLTDHWNNSKEKLSLEEAVSYLEMLKDCCLHLYRKGVAWRDVNNENIMVLEDKSGIKVIDFGFWLEIEDSESRARQLFLGALETVGWIIKSSFIRAGGQKNQKLERTIQYPEYFFGRKVDPKAYQIISLLTYEDADWMIDFNEGIEGKTDREIMRVLQGYFDSVIAELQKHAE